MIKTFKEWYDEEYASETLAITLLENGYNAGVKEATDHFEEEKLRIHEYYHKRVRELTGDMDLVIEPDETNYGKLT